MKQLKIRYQGTTYTQTSLKGFRLTQAVLSQVLDQIHDEMVKDFGNYNWMIQKTQFSRPNTRKHQVCKTVWGTEFHVIARSGNDVFTETDKYNTPGKAFLACNAIKSTLTNLGLI